MRSPARPALLLALLAGATAPGFAAGFLEGRAVEQSVSHPGPVQRVVVEGRYLDVDVDGVPADGVDARAVVSSKFQERNDFKLQIAVADGRASVGFAVNDRLVSGYSVLWGPRLTLAVPDAAEVYIRTTSGDVLVTGLGTTSGRAAVYVRSVTGMVVVTDASADVRLVSGAGDLVIRRVAGDVHVASGSGDITVTDSRGDVRAHTSEGRQRFADIDGTVTVSSREGVTLSGDVREVLAGVPGAPSLPEWGADTPWRRR